MNVSDLLDFLMSLPSRSDTQNWESRYRYDTLNHDRDFDKHPDRYLIGNFLPAPNDDRRRLWNQLDFSRLLITKKFPGKLEQHIPIFHYVYNLQLLNAQIMPQYFNPANFGFNPNNPDPFTTGGILGGQGTGTILDKISKGVDVVGDIIDIFKNKNQTSGSKVPGVQFSEDPYNDEMHTGIGPDFNMLIVIAILAFLLFKK